jgi:Mn-dependent DtxR family transcriptional regulator
MAKQKRGTVSEEDYLERIYELIQKKGYARPVDIAQELSVQQPSVTKMIKMLDKRGYVRYEKYRGISLTQEGEALALSVQKRHETVEKFLRLFDIEEEIVQRDVEGIEHHLSPETIQALNALLSYFEDNEEALKGLKAKKL